ncbi:MAG: EAL domain-containing protein [Burkholderiales bacterium]|nr:EAL domain-containing protein [Burkholderiales bacterium]
MSASFLALDPALRGVPQRSKQLDPRALLDYATNSMLRHREPGKTLALLVLDLRRPDRLDALMAKPASEARFEHVLNGLDALVRAADRYCAVSSGEIWLVLPELGNASLAVLAAIRIVHELQVPDAAGEPEFQLRPCVGIAHFPEHASDVTQLVRMADAACQAAALTEEGYCVAQPRQSPAIARNSELADLVREALRTNALEVHYQPQIDLATGHCASAEALVRWPSSDPRTMPAALIAQIAESTEINHSFTLFILNTALRHTVGLRRLGVQVRMSVNVSATLLNDDELPEILAQSLDAWSVPADQLTVEVTEGTIVSDVKRSVQVLDRVRQLGVRLAMDDFGTGYSSLAQFKRLPFDEIKIDRLFVQNMLQSSGDAQIVRAMVDLAHNFGLVAVAEGVEDTPTLTRLRELGCDLAQGYAISKALPEPLFRDWWLRRRSRSRS